MPIPLNNFIDRSDLRRPKGLLVKSGLTSPLYTIGSTSNFDGQTVLDFRPRDCMDQSYIGPSFDIRPHDIVGPWPFSPSVDISTISYNEYGLITTATSASSSQGILSVVPSKDDNGNDHSSFRMENNRIVWQTIFRITSLDETNWTTYDARNSILLDTTAKYLWRITWDSHSEAPIITNGTSTIYVFDTIDLNKWFAIIMTHDGVNALNYVIQREDQILQETSSLVVGTTPTSTVRLPFHIHFTLGASSLANYSGNNDNGDTGLSNSHWPQDTSGGIAIFEDEHVCNSYSTTGNSITFSCEGEVAWEIYSSGQWLNSDGTSGTNNRVFYADASDQTIETDSFTAIRPVLKNSGNMNTESNAILTFANTQVLNATSINVVVRQTVADTVTQEIKIDEVKFSIQGSHQVSHWQIVESHQTFGNPLINIQSTSNILRNGNVLRLDRNNFHIILKFNTAYKMRVRVKEDGVWSSWSRTFSFRTRDKDYKYTKR